MSEAINCSHADSSYIGWYIASLVKANHTPIRVCFKLPKPYCPYMYLSTRCAGNEKYDRTNSLTKNASLSTSNKEKIVKVDWQGQLESRFTFQVSYK
jgi:hypothetical protein